MPEPIPLPVWKSGWLVELEVIKDERFKSGRRKRYEVSGPLAEEFPEGFLSTGTDVLLSSSIFQEFKATRGERHREHNIESNKSSFSPERFSISLLAAAGMP